MEPSKMSDELFVFKAIAGEAKGQGIIPEKEDGLELAEREVYTEPRTGGVKFALSGGIMAGWTSVQDGEGGRNTDRLWETPAVSVLTGGIYHIVPVLRGCNA